MTPRHFLPDALPCFSATMVLAGVLTLGFAQPEPAKALPNGFVEVRSVIPDIHLDLRYCTEDNFLGARVDGYRQPRAILTVEAAQALKKVQQELQPFGLGLKIFDAYRPQRAVDHFTRWAKDLSDTKMKARYYPGVAKKDLFKEEYIADRSSHTRGSTVDVTIVTEGGEELEMGTGFDFFDPASWPMHQDLSKAARGHRLLLRTLMLKHGFKPYAREWWHFTLRHEPYPQTYFDFPVE